jgi:hypothetical protein
MKEREMASAPVSTIIACTEGPAYLPVIASTPASPAKRKSAVLKSVSSPLCAVSSETSSRGFDEISTCPAGQLSGVCWLIFLLVPVYDGRPTKGRKAFRFLDDDFKNLASWPLYRGGRAELPEEAVVSVGYTLSTYSGNSGPVLSSNLMFVILLAV